MTKEITKAKIIQEIQNKFGLRDFESERFLFGEKVTPTYDVGQHLKMWLMTYMERSITSAPSAAFFYAVPANERWTLRGYNVVFMGVAGAYTVTGVYVQDAQGSVNNVYLDMLLGQSVSYAVNLPQPVILEPGNRIYVYIDSYTSTASLRLYIHYQKEEIR